jgi:hypothetical protein
METAKTAGAKSYARTVVARYKSLIMTKVWEKKASFYVMVFHICNVKKLTVPMVFVIIMKSLLVDILALSWFHHVLNMKETKGLHYMLPSLN